jgi:GT2 family glycosyltransferase
VKLTVGLLTLNCESFLPAQLAALEEGLAGVTEWRLVAADGGSTDGTLDLLKQLAPNATVVRMTGNPGFAAQANAVANADPESDAILIMSRTARLRSGCARRLLEALERPDAGVAVPRLYNAQERLRTSLRRRPTLLRAWAESILGGRVTSRFAALTEVVPDPEKYDERTRFDWATGGLTMFRRDCMQAAGGWDETMFTYSEEVDFELRAADHGYRVVFVPDALATHIGGDSAVRPELWAHLCANRVRLYGKRHRRPAADAFWAAILLGELIRLRSRPATRRAAIAKLVRERRNLVAGRPASHPFAPTTPSAERPVGAR